MAEQAPQSTEREFLFEEYRVTRDRITRDIEDLDKKEILYVTSIAAIYLFIFQYKIVDPFLVFPLLLLSSLISIYGLIRYNATRDIIAIYEGYIKEVIEPKLRFNQDVGMASYYDLKKRSYLKFSRFLLLGTLSIFTIFVLLSAFCHFDYVARIISR